MIDLNISECDLPVYAFDFKTRTLMVFDGVEVTGMANPVRKLWKSQPVPSFLDSVKPLIFWSPSPTEALAPYVFAKKGNWIYRFSRIDYQMARKQGLKGVFSGSMFTPPEDVVQVSRQWFASIIEAYHWDTA